MTGRLIGLGGRLRAGKDAVADHLVDAHGFAKVGMSDALHEAMLAINPILDPGDSAHGGEPATYRDAIAALGYVRTKAEYPEARRLLQALGTEVGRNMIGENVWVDIMKRKIAALRAEGRDVVVTGLRFGNEVLAIADAGGTTIWVHRPSEAASAAVAAHASETSVDAGDFHEVLLNAGTLEELQRTAESLVN